MPLPLPKAFWPLAIVAGVNDRFDVLVDAVKRVATIAAGTYLSPADLALAVQASLEVAYANGWSVSVGPTGRVTVTGSAVFQLLFGTGLFAAVSPRDVLGFEAVDTASAASATGAYQHQNGWYSDDPVEDDTDDLPAWTRSQTRALGGHVRSVQFGGALYDRIISLGFLKPHKVFRAQEGADHPREALERLIESGWARFRWWPDAAVDAVWGDYTLELKTASRLARNRLSPGMARYTYPLTFLRYVDAGSDPAVVQPPQVSPAVEFTTATRPPAGQAWANQLVMVRDAGMPAELHWCRQTAAGGYEWIVVSF